MSASEKLDEELTDFGNAMFDCGAWDEGDGVTYEPLFEKSQVTREALEKAIDREVEEARQASNVTKVDLPSIPWDSES